MLTAWGFTGARLGAPALLAARQLLVDVIRGDALSTAGHLHRTISRRRIAAGVGTPYAGVDVGGCAR